MMILLDSTTRIPPFEQLRAQIALQVSAGALRPGQRLPTIRKLAHQLELSNGPVARAYRELEYAGIINGRGSSGSFVADNPPVEYTADERHEKLTHAAAEAVRLSQQLGATPSELLAAIDSQLRQQEQPS
jgi:DNA-binding transcriptional regulator YhcF (GntR family)